MKRTTRINRNDRSQFFPLTIIVQVCTNRTKNVLNTNCPTLHVAPNMANGTQNHGHTKKEHLVLELDIKNICMDTGHLHQGTTMQNKKKLTSNVHLNNNNCQ